MNRFPDDDLALKISASIRSEFTDCEVVHLRAVDHKQQAKGREVYVLDLARAVVTMLRSEGMIRREDHRRVLSASAELDRALAAGEDGGVILSGKSRAEKLELLFGDDAVVIATTLPSRRE